MAELPSISTGDGDFFVLVHEQLKSSAESESESESRDGADEDINNSSSAAHDACAMKCPGASHRRRRRRRRPPPRLSLSSAAALGILVAWSSSSSSSCGRGVLVASEKAGAEFGRPIAAAAKEEKKKRKNNNYSANQEDASDGSTGGTSTAGETSEMAVPTPVATGATPVLPNQEEERAKDEEFLSWCRHVMGIKMPHVTIKAFEYPNYMLDRRAWEVYNDELTNRRAAKAVLGGDSSLDPALLRQVDMPDASSMVKVRGLAATKFIQPGETLISIPLNAMISVRTTIDHDPVLSTVLGPAQRSAYGWDGVNAPSYEVPLLIVTVLYHVHVLGPVSPLARYADMMRDAPVDDMPFMFDHAELHRRGLSDGVKRVVADIQDDVRDMYVTVVGVLVRDFPGVFGPPKTERGDDLDEWAYSYDKFRWAFAIVNSRHWNVPVQDLDEGGGEAVMRPAVTQSVSSPSDVASPAITPSANQDVFADQTTSVDMPPHESTVQHLSSIGVDGIETPPAAQPTDSFVEQQVAGTVGENSKESNERSESQSADAVPAPVEVDMSVDSTSPSHSFLAPLADLLNFGPPCTRGSYDTATHTFNVVATCDFQPGQEITFYYSGDCEDVIYANYGFTHPMIPPCPTVEDWKKQIDGWKSRSEELDAALVTAYDDMDAMEADITDLANRLEACGCQEDAVPYNADNVPRQAEATQPPAAESPGDEGHQPHPPARRSVTAGGPHKELRGSAQAVQGAEGDGGTSDEGHGGVRRLWRREERDIRDSL